MPQCSHFNEIIDQFYFYIFNREIIGICLMNDDCAILRINEIFLIFIYGFNSFMLRKIGNGFTMIDAGG